MKKLLVAEKLLLFIFTVLCKNVICITAYASVHSEHWCDTPTDPDGTLHPYQLLIKNSSIRYYGKLHENVQHMKCSLNMGNDFKLYGSKNNFERIILWQISVSLSASITSAHSEIAHYSWKDFSNTNYGFTANFINN